MPRAFDAEGRKKGLAAKRASLVKEAHDIRLATIALRARQGRWLKRRATFRKDRRQLIEAGVDGGEDVADLEKVDPPTSPEEAAVEEDEAEKASDDDSTSLSSDSSEVEEEEKKAEAKAKPKPKPKGEAKAKAKAEAKAEAQPEAKAKSKRGRPPKENPDGEDTCPACDLLARGKQVNKAHRADCPNRRRAPRVVV
jgi:outer membrane biosynthesis protein TonB